MKTILDISAVRRYGQTYRPFNIDRGNYPHGLILDRIACILTTSDDVQTAVDVSDIFDFHSIFDSNLNGTYKNREFFLIRPELINECLARQED